MTTELPDAVFLSPEPPGHGWLRGVTLNRAKLLPETQAGTGGNYSELSEYC